MSKYKSESVFSDWANKNDRKRLVIVRPTVIFGEGNKVHVYNLLSPITAKKLIMVGAGKYKKSMAHINNISQFLAKLLSIPLEPGIHVYNYADKPDLDMNGL